MLDTPEPTPPTSSITNTSSGAAATGGGVATGAGGIAVGGDVHGDIHIHFAASPTSASSAPEALAGPPATPSSGNPFGDRGKISDPARYFVRQPLTRQIMEELRKGVSLSIVGETQTGKSSLLWYLSQTAPAALGRPASDGAYLSLELVRNDDEFYEGLCEALGVPVMRGNKLARALRQRRLIVCLDEIEKMTWQGFTLDVRSELRGLADGAAAPLTLVIASRTPLGRLFPDSPEMTSPLGGLCLQMAVPPFSLAEAHALAAQRLLPLGQHLPAPDIEAAWRDTGGHPARLQEALKQAFDRHFPV